MKHLFFVVAGCAFLGTLVAADDPMAEIMAVTQKNSVTVKEKQTDKKGTDKIPLKRRSVFTFKTPAGERQIIYNRWLNKQPDFKGKHPSLNWESGVGFGVGKFGNWYGNNTIRVFINNVDVMAKSPAEVKFADGEQGVLTLTWDLGSKRSLALDFRVMPENNRVYCQIRMELPGMNVKSIRVNLRGYPGGYAPAYKLPSERYGVADKDIKCPMVKNKVMNYALSPEGQWAFSGDKIAKNGAIAAIFDPVGSQGKATMKISYYEGGFSLTYPGTVRKINLGLYAFTQQNDAAFSAFRSRVAKDMKEIKAIYK